tara:strand:- start:67 stop:651 length:585 start_codon:yes stop_codon:yes gene_type:complete
MSDYKENQFYPIWSLIVLVNSIFEIEARWYYGNTRTIVNIGVIILSPILGAILAMLFILHTLEFLMMNYGRGVGEVWEINNYTILLIKCIAVVTLLPVLIYASPWLLVRFIKETREDRRRLAELKKAASEAGLNTDIDEYLFWDNGRDGIPTEWEMTIGRQDRDEVDFTIDLEDTYDKMSPRRRMMNHKIDMTK